MASENVNRIVEAEKAAEEKIASAHEKAASIISDAKVKSVTILEQKRADAIKENERLKTINDAEIKKIYDDQQNLTEKAAKQLKKNADEKKQAAIDAVKSFIIPAE